jgi:hypothetical protein
MKFSPPYGCFLILLALTLIGCSDGSNPFNSVPVSGKVVYEDGTAIPVQSMMLYFYSEEPPKEGMHPRPARVGVGADGTFKEITTYKLNDGLVLGKHKISIVCQENGKPSKKIPKECSNPTATPLEIEVTHSGQVLEIKVPKPKS